MIFLLVHGGLVLLGFGLGVLWVACHNVPLEDPFYDSEAPKDTDEPDESVNHGQSYCSCDKKSNKI